MQFIKVFPILTILIVCTIFMTIKRNRSMKKMVQDKDDFWKRENEANNVRKQDISGLDYIKIPDSILNLSVPSDCAEMMDQIKLLSEKSILNLNGISNTDIKLQYGVANLTFLNECDDNYTTLVTLLANLGEKIYEAGDVTSATTILEFSVDIQSDISKCYEILKKIYLESENETALANLRSKAEALSSIRKDIILAKLT